MNVDFISLEEKQGVIKALEVTSRQLSLVLTDSGAWLWAIIGLHNTLQGLMVLSLTRGSGLNVLSDKHAKKFVRFLGLEPENKTEEEIREFVNLDYLKHFMCLFEDIQSDKMERYIGSRAFNPTSSQAKSVNRLNDYRNKFIHFYPQTFIITQSELLKIFDDCLAIMSFLVFESGNIMWHNEDLEVQAEQLIHEVQKTVNNLNEI